MKFTRIFFIIVVILLLQSRAICQEYIADKPYQYQVGLYWNAIDDDGDPFNGLLRFRPSWNMIPLPTSLSFDYHIKGGFSTEALLNFNRYKFGSKINNSTNKNGFVFNLDINAKYAFGQLMTQPFFDPFIFGGVSYTLRPPNIWRHMLAPNVGVGFNFFIREDIAFQLRTAAKIGVVPEFFTHHSNYLHHHFGVIYVLNAMPWNQDFSKKRYNWLFKNYNWKGNNRQ